MNKFRDSIIRCLPEVISLVVATPTNLRGLVHMKYTNRQRFSFNISQGFEGLIINDHIYFPFPLCFLEWRVSLVFRFFRRSYFSSRGAATNRVVLSMKQSIGNVFPKYLTRVCRIDSYREGSSSIFLVFSLFKKKEGCPWWFRWVISVTVAIPTSGVGLRMKAMNRQRFPQIPHKNLQDRLLLRRVFFHFPCVFFV